MFEEMTFSAFESRFRNKSYIGSGGFAKVYKVFDHAKNHYVALKVADVRPEWKKFTLQREVELVNSLPGHRNIARYDGCYRFNTGLTGEMDFAILKFYEYGNLEQFVTKQTLSQEDKKLIIRGILDGIDFLHRHDVIHRDLKAQNILLHREDGVWTPKIIDFGLSRQIGGESTVTNSAIGLTYAYAAPEQIQNKKIFKNVDLWAIGVIVYRMIAGELPFKGRNGGDERSTQSQLELSRKIINLELPEKLETLEEPYRTLIKSCFVLEPSERAQNADDLIKILNQGRGSYYTDPLPVLPKVEPLNEDATQLVDNLNADKTMFSNLTADDINQIRKDATSERPVSEVVPENKTISEDAPTEVILPAPKPAAPPTHTPNPTADPNVILAQNKNNQPPPIYQAITRNEYKDIPSNPTQIIDQPVNVSEPAPLVNTYEPKIGGGEKSRNWLLYLLPFLLLGGLIGGYFLLVNRGESVENPAVQSESNAPIPLGEKAEGKEAEILAIKPTGEARNSKSSTPTDIIFRELDRENYGARKDNKKLSALKLKIDEIIVKYPKLYKPSFILAKNRAYAGKLKGAFKSLKLSAEKAIRSKQQDAHLRDLEKDKMGAFKELYENHRNQWNKLINALEGKKATQ